MASPKNRELLEEMKRELKVEKARVLELLEKAEELYKLVKTGKGSQEMPVKMSDEDKEEAKRLIIKNTGLGQICEMVYGDTYQDQQKWSRLVRD